MSKRELPERNPVDQAFAEFMADSLKGRKPLPVKEGQAPSTQRILERPVSEDVPMWLRPDPIGWEADKFAARTITEQEAQLIQGMRQSGHGNTLGQSELESVSKIRKMRATQDWLYPEESPHLDPVEVRKHLYKAKPQGLFARLFDKLFRRNESTDVPQLPRPGVTLTEWK